jgi:DNA-binding NarL/FixJ family response regulator
MHRLTPRQRQIAKLQGTGMNQKQIAAHLNLSLGTVKTHMSRSLARTHSGSSHELQHQIRVREMQSIKDKIAALLSTSQSYCDQQSKWPKS